VSTRTPTTLLRVLNAHLWKAAGDKVMGKEAKYVKTTNQ